MYGNPVFFASGCVNVSYHSSFFLLVSSSNNRDRTSARFVFLDFDITLINRQIVACLDFLTYKLIHYKTYNYYFIIIQSLILLVQLLLSVLLSLVSWFLLYCYHYHFIIVPYATPLLHLPSPLVCLFPPLVFRPYESTSPLYFSRKAPSLRIAEPPIRFPPPSIFLTVLPFSCPSVRPSSSVQRDSSFGKNAPNWLRSCAPYWWPGRSFFLVDLWG